MRQLALSLAVFVACLMPALASAADTPANGATATSGAAAQKGTKTTTTKTNLQHEKVKACNKEATTKNLKGEERKKFMADCTSGKSAT